VRWLLAGLGALLALGAGWWLWRRWRPRRSNLPGPVSTQWMTDHIYRDGKQDHE
jgi:hypothetical protein